VLIDDLLIEQELYNLRYVIFKDELLAKSEKTIPLVTAFQLEYENAE
jgi:hypothetical protein